MRALDVASQSREHVQQQATSTRRGGLVGRKPLPLFLKESLQGPGGAAVQAVVARGRRYRRACELVSAVTTAYGVPVHYRAHVRLRRSLTDLEDQLTSV